MNSHMMSNIFDLYKTVHTAWLEGRLENVLQRQKELATLHAAIKDFTTQLIKGLQSDLNTTEDSAIEEIKAVLDIVKYFYDTLDFSRSIREESAIKGGANVGKGLVPLGPSLIEPNPHTPLSSTLIPLAAAVAGGSAVIVLTTPAAPVTSKLLKNIIEESLDHEAVKVTWDNTSQTRLEIGSQYFGVAVLQDTEQPLDLQNALYRSNRFIRVLTPSSGFPAAFIDRSARDLEAVASSIRLSILRSPRHQPLRVPRLLFVDEIIIDDLVKCLHRSSGAKDEYLKKGNSDEERPLRELLMATFPSLAESLSQSSSASLPSIISLKNTDPIIVQTIRVVAKSIASRSEGVLIIPIRSLDHGVDLLDKLNGKETSQATYIFGSGKASFYVGTFSQSLNIFINHIPQRSLVTIVPFSPTASYELPYTQEDFSFNKSINQERAGTTLQLTGSFLPILSHKLWLGKIHQPKGGRLSYFERGLIVGLAVTIFAVSGVSFAASRVVGYYLKRV